MTQDDIEWAVDVLAERRAALIPHAPLFWRSAQGARERLRDFLGQHTRTADYSQWNWVARASATTIRSKLGRNHDCGGVTARPRQTSRGPMRSNDLNRPVRMRKHARPPRLQGRIARPHRGALERGQAPTDPRTKMARLSSLGWP